MAIRLVLCGIVSVVCSSGTPPPKGHDLVSEVNKRIDEAAEAIRSLVSRHNVGFVVPDATGQGIVPLKISAPARSVYIDKFTGRVSEIYNADFFEKLDHETSLRLQDQLKVDAEKIEFQPRINDMTEVTEIGTVQLGDVVHRGHSTTIFKIVGDDTKLIKYQVHSEQISSTLHPLLADAWYMNEAHEAGVGPRVLAVSPPSLLCEKQQGKCKFRMTPKEYQICTQRQCTVRYMIMERVGGINLYQLKIQRKLEMTYIFRIGVNLISKLWKLHTEALVVHGDVHSGNVMLVQQPDGRYTIRLVDFGRAFRYRQNITTQRVNKPGFWFHYLLTSWQMRGYAWAARDDIARAIQIIAQLMNPVEEYGNYEKGFEKSGIVTMLVWKEQQDWFSMPNFDPIENLPGINEETKAKIRDCLDGILHIVRNLGINDPIPYDDIMDFFEMAAEFSFPRANTAPATEQSVPVQVSGATVASSVGETAVVIQPTFTQSIIDNSSVPNAASSTTPDPTSPTDIETEPEYGNDNSG
jgi:serine/threonine protein kinase